MNEKRLQEEYLKLDEQLRKYPSGYPFVKRIDPQIELEQKIQERLNEFIDNNPSLSHKDQELLYGLQDMLINLTLDMIEYNRKLFSEA